jgi:hypothetical protein
MFVLTPVAELAVLAAAALPLGRLLRGRALPPGASAAVMAVGIFALAALPALPGGAALRQPLALAVLVLWALLALRFATAWRNGDDPRLRPPMARIAVGTWIAGTAVTAALVAAAVPGWTPLAAPLVAVALALWPWYLLLVAAAVRQVAGDARQPVTGSVLLVTVATQSTALLCVIFTRPPALPDLMVALVALGTAAYLAGAALMVRAWLHAPRWRLDEDWHNSNCILHGAVSITGLAAILSGAVPAPVCLALWLFAATMFAAVESIEIARLVLRLRRHGWRRGVLCYDTSQWARNFTFGMFYALTRNYLARFSAPSITVVAALQHALAAGGQYVVLVLLLVEIGLLVAAWRAGEV